MLLEMARYMLNVAVRIFFFPVISKPSKRLSMNTEIMLGLHCYIWWEFSSISKLDYAFGKIQETRSVT